MSAPPRRVFFTDRDIGNIFPDALSEAGLSVERHADHFPHDCEDDVWLSAVGQRGWTVVTHDERIRYKPNEIAAVRRHGVGMLLVVGKVPLPLLAANFVATLPKIEAFLEGRSRPFIGKVHRPSPGDLKKDPAAKGRVELWYPK